MVKLSLKNCAGEKTIYSRTAPRNEGRSGFALHPGAASGITAIWEFIAKDNPASARRVRENILGAIRKLVLFPNQGHQRTDLSSGTLRFQTVGNYLIAYAPEGEPLVVIAVLHGRRNPRVMASILRGRK